MTQMIPKPVFRRLGLDFDLFCELILDPFLKEAENDLIAFIPSQPCPCCTLEALESAIERYTGRCCMTPTYAMQHECGAFDYYNLWALNGTIYAVDSDDHSIVGVLNTVN